MLGFRELPEEGESRVGELWVTPVLVEHTVPTTGFVIHDGETGFVFSGDTGPTKRIWQIAREMRGLKALIVETAFPNRLSMLAKASGHLTPEMLRQEIDKMPPDLPIWIYHIKPQLYQETAEELAKIDPDPHPHPGAGQDLHHLVGAAPLPLSPLDAPACFRTGGRRSGGSSDPGTGTG